MSYDLHNELGQKLRLLDQAVRQLGKRGRTYAQAERDYKVALAQQMLKERSNGQPATILSDICRGNREIAKLRFERDVAEVDYKAAGEAINSYKLQIRIIEAQIDREWTTQK